MGLDERFVRMWDFYLCYCEAAFDERSISVVQMAMARPTWRPHAAAVSTATDRAGRSISVG